MGASSALCIQLLPSPGMYGGVIVGLLGPLDSDCRPTFACFGTRGWWIEAFISCVLMGVQHLAPG
jgi:hypothetical protein